MGKRSTSTTKSGKFMNPTDQARKEARRKELKKNKKQRLLVRHAVLKGKDPSTIFTELEKIDQMEFNPVDPAPLSEKVLGEKRKKLRETLNRVIRLYEKEDPTMWSKVKAMEQQYEKRRQQLIIYCESVRHAQSVKVEEIPLPVLEPAAPTASDGAIVPPAKTQGPTHSILKATSMFQNYSNFRKPPGVPSVPPPSLADIWDEGDAAGFVEPGIPGIDDEEEGPPYHTYYEYLKPAEEPIDHIEVPEEDEDGPEDLPKEAAPEESMESEPSEVDKPQVKLLEVAKPTSLQQKMLAMAGQDVDTFMKEMEVVQREREKNLQVDLENRLQRIEKGQDAAADFPPPPPGHFGHPQPPPMPPHYPMGPPGMYPGFVRLPPGPPPRMPAGMAPPRLMRPAMPPPPPPPGLRGPAPAAPLPQQAKNLAVKAKGPSVATIEAKPQMRNLSADLTRFVPTALKLKKDAPAPASQVKKDTRTAPKIAWKLPQGKSVSQSKPGAPQPTKDDAYSQFMKEMQGLM